MSTALNKLFDNLLKSNDKEQEEELIESIINKMDDMKNTLGHLNRALGVYIMKKERKEGCGKASYQIKRFLNKL